MPKNPESFEPTEKELKKEVNSKTEEKRGEEGEEIVEQEDKEKKGINLFEKSFLRDSEKADLILTYLKEKPCTDIEIIYSAKNPLSDVQDIEKRISELEELLKTTGLSFSILESEGADEHGFDYKIIQFIIGSSENDVLAMKKAMEANDVRTKGILYGFPETAVDSFDNGLKNNNFDEIMLNQREWWNALTYQQKKDLLRIGIPQIMCFKPSKKHLKSEINTLEKWLEVIKEKAPDLYERIIKNKPEFILTKEELEKLENNEA